MRTILRFLIMTPVIAAVAVFGQSPAEAQSGAFPSLTASVRISQPLDFCGEAVEMDNRDVRERLEKELLLTLWDRPQVVLWIKRSGRYLPIIEKMLAENGLPDDLKYIAIVESALRPHAGSRKGAIGFWQFMDATGRKYGLRVNSEKDERRNIFRSTEAAIKYFKTLYDMFGAWTLVAAAYNMGEQGLESEILSQRTRNYYQLYLPLETQRYVLRIISAKIVLSAPQTYGFQISRQDLYPPLEFERIELACFQETPLTIVAQAAHTYFKVVKDLNPEIRGHFLAPGSHSLLLPKGAAEGFHARFKKLLDQWVATARQRVYVVRQGDNLSTIARRFNVPLQALVIWNRLDNQKHIYPGNKLVIYPGEIGSDEINADQSEPEP